MSHIFLGSCTVPKLVTDITRECNPPFDESHQETRMYNPRWRDGKEVEDSQVKKRSASGYLSPWVYLDPSESNSSSTFYGRIAFYPGGGYVAELGDTVKDTAVIAAYLKNNHWIDRYTRAVFIEGAVYNPNTNLVGVMETVIEVTPANGLLPRTNLKIFRLFAELNPSYALNSACEFLTLGIVLYTLYKIIKGIYMRKKDHFREVISWLDMIFFLNGIAIAVVYILREMLLKRAVQALHKKESFLNVSECGMMSEQLVFLYAFAAFIAILKFVHFLSFTRIVQLLSTTIYRSVAELQSFAVMLFTVFMGYVSLAHTIYGPYLEDYRSVSSTSASLTCLMMGVFDFTDFISQTDYKMVGYFFFSTFTSSMIFIFTNMIVTIINVVHKDVCEDKDLKKDQIKFFDIILHRLLTLTGFRGPPQRDEPIIEEPPISEMQWNSSVQYLMDNQLKRLHRLVNSIYIQDEMEDTIFINQLSKRREKENKPELFITEDGMQENAPDHTPDYDQGLRVDAEMNSIQRPLSVNIHPQTNTKLATEELKKPTDAIVQLIAKKTEELRCLEEGGNCDETERLLRVKVIKCLQELHEKRTNIV